MITLHPDLDRAIDKGESRNAKPDDFILRKSLKPVKTVRFAPKDKAPT